MLRLYKKLKKLPKRGEEEAEELSVKKIDKMSLSEEEFCLVSPVKSNSICISSLFLTKSIVCSAGYLNRILVAL
jgi:hypothetical protein